MYYTLTPTLMWQAPDQAKEQITKWLREHGINPDTCCLLTIDLDLRGVAHEHYLMDGFNRIRMHVPKDTTKAPTPMTEKEWTYLKEGEPAPDFLIYMQPSQNAPTSLGPAGTNPNYPLVGE